MFLEKRGNGIFFYWICYEFLGNAITFVDAHLFFGSFYWLYYCSVNVIFFSHCELCLITVNFSV